MGTLLDDVQTIAALLEQAGAPLPPAFLATVAASQAALDAQLAITMAQIDAGLSSEPAKPVARHRSKPKPRRRGR